MIMDYNQENPKKLTVNYAFNKLLFLCLFTFFTISMTTVQEFAPVGAEWYYNEQFFSSGDINYIKYSVEKDTLIKGKTCSEIVKRHPLYCYNRPINEFVYSSNDTVFFYDPFVDDFQVLYVFSAEADESWKILLEGDSGSIDTLTITVDSVKTLSVNETELKTLFVTYDWLYSHYTSKIIEKVGDVKFMFNWEPYAAMACDGNFTNGLRCYYDADIEWFSIGIAGSCDYIHYWDGVENQVAAFNVSVNPNPVIDEFEICVASSIDEEYNFELYNIQGKRLFSRENIPIEKAKIDMSDYPSGVYFYKIIGKATHRVSTGEIIKQ